MCICRIIFLTGASKNYDDSFPFFLSFFSFCALQRFRRAWSALSCYLPLFVPFPLPSFFPTLSILLGGGGACCCTEGVRGGGGGGGVGVGLSQPAPSFPLRREILAQVGSSLVSMCLVVGGGGLSSALDPKPRTLGRGVQGGGGLS